MLILMSSIKSMLQVNWDNSMKFDVFYRNAAFKVRLRMYALTSALSVQDKCTTPAGLNLVNSASKLVNLLLSSKKLKYFKVNSMGSWWYNRFRGILAVTAILMEPEELFEESVDVRRESRTEMHTGFWVDGSLVSWSVVYSNSFMIAIKLLSDE